MKLGISRSVVAGLLSVALLGGGMPAATAEDVPAADTGTVAAVAPEPDIDPLEQSTNVLAFSLGDDVEEGTLILSVDGLSVEERSAVVDGVKEMVPSLSGYTLTTSADLKAKFAKGSASTFDPRHPGPILTNPNGTATTAAALVTLKCRQERQLVDQNLTLNLRNQCPDFNSVNVNFTINKAVRNIIGSNVRERGIDRWYNGVKQSRLAPHRSQPSGYLWHGVLSAAKAPMTIKIDDSLNFSVVIKKKVYPASIYMCKTFKITK